jgi:hypothetical protein
VTDSTPGGDRSQHKRSWKNLLINKRYQLRFTLFMVGLTSLLMAGLGVWVMLVANETTTISKSSVRGVACPEALRSLRRRTADDTASSSTPSPAPRAAPADPGPPADSTMPAAAPPVASGDPAGDPATGTAAKPGATADRAEAPKPPSHAGDGSAGGSGRPPRGIDEPRRGPVQLEESSMTLTPPPPPPPPQVVSPNELADQITEHWKCELAQVAERDRLERGRLRILWAMIATGLLLVLGLAAYGLKMTHRVAGPLFKVRLYLTKMRQGRFDTVYNLRKGDQLIEFYDHFKRAHGGVVAMQRADLDQLAKVIAAADAAGAGHHPAVVALRELALRKEKSIE